MLLQGLNRFYVYTRATSRVLPSTYKSVEMAALWEHKQGQLRWEGEWRPRGLGIHLFSGLLSPEHLSSPFPLLNLVLVLPVVLSSGSWDLARIENKQQFTFSPKQATLTISDLKSPWRTFSSTLQRKGRTGGNRAEYLLNVFKLWCRNLSFQEMQVKCLMEREV